MATIRKTNPPPRPATRATAQARPARPRPRIKPPTRLPEITNPLNQRRRPEARREKPPPDRELQPATRATATTPRQPAAGAGRRRNRGSSRPGIPRNGPPMWSARATPSPAAGCQRLIVIWCAGIFRAKRRRRNEYASRCAASTGFGLILWHGRPGRGLLYSARKNRHFAHWRGVSHPWAGCPCHKKRPRPVRSQFVSIWLLTSDPRS